jgi:hypothetical protein
MPYRGQSLVPLPTYEARRRDLEVTKSLTRHNGVFQAAARPDEHDAAVWIPSFQLLCHGDAGVEVATRSTSDNDNAHDPLISR